MMLKTRDLLVSVLIFAALAACSDGPTLVSDVQVPASPAFDGGHMLGSGGRVEDPSNTPAVVSMETTAGDSTSITEERGGHTLGSGH